MTLTQGADPMLDATKRIASEKAAVQASYDIAVEKARAGATFWAAKAKALELRLWELGTMH
jgi:hypothetical protein